MKKFMQIRNEILDFHNRSSIFLNHKKNSTEKQQSPFLRAIFHRAGIYDVIQFTVKKFAERVQSIGRDGFIRLHPADGRTADAGLGLQGICGRAMLLHGLPQGLV